YPHPRWVGKYPDHQILSRLVGTLHQGESLFRMGRPSIDQSMLWPLFIMLAAFGVLFVALLLGSMRAEIFRRRIRAAEFIAATPGGFSSPLRGGVAPRSAP